MTKKLIAGNWKMHGRREAALLLAKEIKFMAASAHADVLICPPAPLLDAISNILQGSNVRLGGQDCSDQEEGAYTGDIAAYMLKEAGCSYVILGHSERRQYHDETDEMVRAKAEMAIRYGLTPIICIGETLEIREAGQAEKVVSAQVKASIPQGNEPFILAYEPIWAIGTGKIPTLDDIESMHANIRLATGNNEITVLYGGSVKPGNARDIMNIPGVGGALVGGASLNAKEFGAIIDSCPS